MAKDYSDKYNTPIPDAKRPAFNHWVDSQRKAGRDPLRDKFDYDVQGYWLSGAANDPRGHGPDTFKKPNHPTFSNESIYHGVNGNYGGHWGENDTFVPSITNLQHRSVDQLQQYFKDPRNQENPNGLQPMPTDPIGNAGAPPQMDMHLQNLFTTLLGLR